MTQEAPASIGKKQSMNVGQGEFYVSSDVDQVMSAILGSCVATCLWDEQAGVGGMNHILLPDAGDDPTKSAFYAVNAIELLVNAIHQKGGVKSRFKAKLFGGAKMISGLSDIGERNAKIAQDFLKAEDIPCVSMSLGGTLGRRIQFWPTTGRVRQMTLGMSDVPEQKVAVKKPPAAEQDIDLF